MPDARPAVSVVVPTWNRRALLREAVASVLAQSMRAWELIVVDDGSTDGTAAEIEALGDDRIRLLRLEHSGNIARLRNAGAAASIAPLLAFLDSDDLWLPPKLEVQLAAMAATRAAWSYTAFEHVDEDGRPVPPRAGRWVPLSGAILEQVLTTEASPFVSTLVVDRRLFERVGAFDEPLGLEIFEDHDLVIRLAAAAPALAVDQVLARARVHPGRTTSARADNFRRMARVYTKFLDGRPPAHLRRIARRRRGEHRAEEAARLLGDRRVAALALLARAAADGAPARLLASALARGLRASVARREPRDAR